MQIRIYNGNIFVLLGAEQEMCMIKNFVLLVFFVVVLLFCVIAHVDPEVLRDCCGAELV